MKYLLVILLLVTSTDPVLTQETNEAPYVDREVAHATVVVKKYGIYVSYVDLVPEWREVEQEIQVPVDPGAVESGAQGKGVETVTETKTRRKQVLVEKQVEKRITESMVRLQTVG